MVGVEEAVAAADKCAISSWKGDVNSAVWCYQCRMKLGVENADATIDNCKNEHPAGQGSSQSQGGFGNRFSALDNNNQGGRNRSGGFGSSKFVRSFLFAL